MHIGELESILLFVSDLDAAKRFYVDLLRLPITFEDGIMVVLTTGSGRVVLHRNDRGHDDRGIFPVGVCVSAWMTPMYGKWSPLEDAGGLLGKVRGHWRS
jgi:catechol 2,3-dioxygenase-like lactoylglutathione lyase family enzyme